jgi:hypothetical protein
MFMIIEPVQGAARCGGFAALCQVTPPAHVGEALLKVHLATLSCNAIVRPPKKGSRLPGPIRSAGEKGRYFLD